MVNKKSLAIKLGFSFWLQANSHLLKESVQI
jgi:hypothetical protein